MGRRLPWGGEHPADQHKPTDQGAEAHRSIADPSHETRQQHFYGIYLAIKKDYRDRSNQMF
jgi:hypothetical protein